MNSRDEQRAIEVFEAALEHEQHGRCAYLDEACRGDPELRAEVESLLKADEQAGGFLEPPAQATRQPSPQCDPLVGAKIGRYHIQSVIAAGGMGTVYEALQEEPRRAVALKVIRPGMASRSALERFKHESEILGRLRHPGIAQIYEAGTHGGDHGAPFFAMEFIPGARPITRYAEEERLSTRECLRLFIKVCDAVQAGHQRGIIYRDLKPANILVDEQGQPKLIDFGVARASDADMTIATLQTDVGELVGTLRYMSPEQCEGDAIELDMRSDVYALGVVLFELLTGDLPYDFSTTSPFDVPRVIREQEPRRMSAVNRMLRGDIETVVLKALEKNRVRRYQSVPELIRDIQNYLKNEPIEAKRGRRWYMFCKALRRHRIAVTVSAAFVFVAIASALSLAVLYRDSERQRGTAEQRAEQLRRAVYLNDITLAQRAYDIGDGIELSRRLANCPADLRGWEWHYLNRLADTSIRTLSGHTAAVAACAVSPDGRLIATGGWDGALRLWDSATWREVNTLTPGGYVEQISFSPDGQHVICAGRKNQQAYLWNVTTGQRDDTCKIRTEYAAAFSPDGTRIAAGSDYHEPLRVWDAATGQVIREWPDTKRTRPIDVAWSPNSEMLTTSRSDGTVVLLDVASGRTVRSFTGHSAAVRHVIFSPDGETLASTGFDNTLRLWNVGSGEQIRVFCEISEIINGVAFSPDGRRVAGGCASALRVWDVVSGKPEAVRLGHTGFVGAVIFTPDGNHILTTSHDQTLKIWDAQPVQEPPILATSDGAFASAAVSPDGKRVACGDESGRLRILEMPSRAELSSTQAHDRCLWALSFSHTGDRLASGADDGNVHIWSASMERPLITLHVPKTGVLSLAWTPDDQRIATGHSDGVVRIWEAATGRLIHTITAHEGSVMSVSFTNDGVRVITAGGGLAVRMWNAETAEHIRDWLMGAHGNVAAISPSERLVVAGTNEHDVWAWDLESGERRWKAKGHLGLVQALAFTLDEHWLVTGGYNHQIRIWDMETGESTLTLRNHDGGVRALAMSPNGHWFVSASIDKTVRLWSADNADGKAP